MNNCQRVIGFLFALMLMGCAVACGLACYWGGSFWWGILGALLVIGAGDMVEKVVFRK